MRIDGGGNLIAMDGRGVPPVLIQAGRDYMRGPNIWRLIVAWGLKSAEEVREGDMPYCDSIELVLSFCRTRTRGENQ